VFVREIEGLGLSLVRCSECGQQVSLDGNVAVDGRSRPLLSTSSKEW